MGKSKFLWASLIFIHYYFFSPCWKWKRKKATADIIHNVLRHKKCEDEIYSQSEFKVLKIKKILFKKIVEFSSFFADCNFVWFLFCWRKNFQFDSRIFLNVGCEKFKFYVFSFLLRFIFVVFYCGNYVRYYFNNHHYRFVLFALGEGELGGGLLVLGVKRLKISQDCFLESNEFFGI